MKETIKSNRGSRVAICMFFIMIFSVMLLQASSTPKKIVTIKITPKFAQAKKGYLQEELEAEARRGYSFDFGAPQDRAQTFQIMAQTFKLPDGKTIDTYIENLDQVAQKIAAVSLHRSDFGVGKSSIGSVGIGKGLKGSGTRPTNKLQQGVELQIDQEALSVDKILQPSLKQLKKEEKALGGVPIPPDLIEDINKLINENQGLKNKVVSLAGKKATGILKEIDQSIDCQKINHTLKNIDDIESEKDIKIAELEKEVDYLGTALLNVLKTFDVNINSKEFSDTLKKELTKLDTKESAKLVNEAMANELYCLKFMYAEARYLLEWTNLNINWKTEEAKGTKPPVLKDDFSEDQIKNMVMGMAVSF
jgi:hypothetical protein